MTHNSEKLGLLALELSGLNLKYDFLSFAKEAVKRGMKLNHSDLRMLSKSFLGNNPSLRKIRSRFMFQNDFFIPEIILRFVSEYLSNETGLHILDPCARNGGFINEIAESTNAKKAVAISLNRDEIEIGKLLSNFSNMEWKQEDPLQALETIENKFDVIVSCPPFNMGPNKEITVGENNIKIKDNKSNLIISKSSMLLSENGIAFYVIPNNFFFGGTKSSSRNTLSELGLYIDAVFSLPAGAFLPLTSIPSNLIVIKRKQYEKLFVAELNPNTNSKPILENWNERREAKSFSLGQLVDIHKFTSYQALSSQNEMERLALRSGLKSKLLSDIYLEMNLENKKLENGFEEKPNSVYLPLIGFSDAVSQLSSLKIKPQNYIQIVLDPLRAHSDYIARFFNTKLGKLCRESVTSVGAIPKITKLNLSGAKIYLPVPEIQSELIEIQSEITDLKTQLNTIQSSLWEKPLQYNHIRKALKSMNKEKGIVNWLETLPFPLASILRRYHADHDSRSKNDHLLFFFEAFAQFVTTVMFSALKNDEVLFEKQRTSWIKDKLADRLKMSSFGIWGILGEQLAKITRRELSSKDSRDRCLRMYRVKRSDFLDTITNKKIYEIISTTAGYRNNWKGHGGIVGEKEQKNRQTLLENELSKIREIISDCFEDSIFLRPKDNTYSKGVYNYVIMSLMGSHTTFKEEEIRTIIPLDISKNYILFEDNPEPLELIPFVKFMSTPESEETACYFYNRIEKNKIRWVSYHFEKESEIMSEDKALTAFISNFENQDNKSR